uniref:Uncharacterized protein n=1 Tax=Picea glauca TaxID=3330 RepID=A0A101M2Z9_PICGL|nr:hypothetical protein ABT39_MTgene3117 [Picea glauca]QHR86467.1 hypothetical protein Q903MT_gene467 [Picea sitchensis]
MCMLCICYVSIWSWAFGCHEFLFYHACVILMHLIILHCALNYFILGPHEILSLLVLWRYCL